MKLSIAIPVLLSAPLGVFAAQQEPGVWKKCAYSLYCKNHDECRQAADCHNQALNHYSGYIFCGIGAWEYETCWVYAARPKNRAVRGLEENANATEPVIEARDEDEDELDE
ncbi:hypothetical protein GX51_02593 [Blastomyces parvus]|uniref:Extracellular membrane protein CFEM domain-containing protein n=1 Tax=Blastomyces parvus TaxID=2060905 RepID=A0A2B7XB94_9EURO|nr:hypothetical protein GX51_02593 [Blastomyces parvus]